MSSNYEECDNCEIEKNDINIKKELEDEQWSSDEPCDEACEECTEYCINECKNNLLFGSVRTYACHNCEHDCLRNCDKNMTRLHRIQKNKPVIIFNKTLKRLQKVRKPSEDDYCDFCYQSCEKHCSAFEDSGDTICKEHWRECCAYCETNPYRMWLNKMKKRNERRIKKIKLDKEKLDKEKL